MTVYPARSESLPSHFPTNRGETWRDEANFVYEADESDSRWYTNYSPASNCTKCALETAHSLSLPLSPVVSLAVNAPVAFSSREHNNRKRAEAPEPDHRGVCLTPARKKLTFRVSIARNACIENQTSFATR